MPVPSFQKREPISEALPGRLVEHGGRVSECGYHKNEDESCEDPQETADLE